jgi:dTDP-4-dehydrorhamnose reductase
MKVLILGGNGQVGRSLKHHLAFVETLIVCDRAKIDFLDSQKLQDLIVDHNPDIVINAVAYTQVDRAEIEQALAMQVNANAVASLAEVCHELDIWLIHYSTDYVFDGKAEISYTEDHKTNPINFYGKSKLRGEDLLCERHNKYLILRTSWVYSLFGNNFAHSILKAAMLKEQLQVVSDVYGVPTHADLLANITALVVYKITQGLLITEHAGIYHLTPSGETTWYDYAKLLISEAKLQGLALKVQELIPVTQDFYNSGVMRPQNSRLSTKKISATFDLNLPSWKLDVIDFVAEFSIMLKKLGDFYAGSSFSY